MLSDMTWRINIKNMQTKIRVGICDHEKLQAQNILINAVIDSEYSAQPESIEECFNYDSIYQLVVVEWPQKTHIDLLETWAFELLSYIFNSDKKVKYAKVSITKPDIYKEAESVGVEAEWTREDFNKLASSKT